MSITLITLLQGCSTTPDTKEIPVEERGISAPELQSRVSTPGIVPEGVPGADVKSTTQTPAVIALLDSAKDASDRGDIVSASAALERALRLQPKDAPLWHQLGQIRYQQQQWQQAIDCARKSNSLAAGNTALQIQNWQLIVRVKERVQDHAGAAQGRGKIRELTLGNTR